MAISPDDFDIPVSDYDFANISTPASLIDQMANAGGFTATKLATARNILQEEGMDPDRGAGYINVKDLGKDKSEIS